jgi:hypothetical protein
MKTTIIILLAATFMMACEQKGKEKTMDSNNEERQGTVEKQYLWPVPEPVSALTDMAHQQNVGNDEIKNVLLEKLESIQPWYAELGANRISYNPDREDEEWFLDDEDVLPYMKDTVLVNLKKGTSAILSNSYKTKILKRGESLNEPFNLTFLMTGNRPSAEINGYFDIHSHSSIFMILAGRGDELQEFPRFEGDDTPAPKLPKEEELDIYKQMIKVDESGKKATAERMEELEAFLLNMQRVMGFNLKLS